MDKKEEKSKEQIPSEKLLNELSQLDENIPFSERVDALEHEMSEELDRITVKSVIFTSGERDPRLPPDIKLPLTSEGENQKYFLMGHDPRLSKMPDKPTLMDFFKHRFAPAAHVLQSARLAQKNGYDEKVIIACLLHDISMIGFIRGDHGYWGAQLVAPYVDEEISWAIRAHQVLRFYPDESVGYTYPELYVRLFGPNYKPEPHIEAAYKRMYEHKWYMTARLITVNDVYSFDPNVVVNLEDFTDIIGRNFKQPEEGLGFDDSPSSHMWRTINWPTRCL